MSLREMLPRPLTAALTVVLATFLGAAATAVAQPTKTCFPTCSETDARFLSLVGDNLQSLAGDEITFNFRVPPGETSFDMEIFDGETSGLWDIRGSAVEFVVSADPDNSGTVDSAETSFGPFLGSNMIDNGWHTISVPTGDHARLTSAGDYFFILRARLVDPTISGTWSNFKIRANANIMMRTQAFAFAAPLFTMNEARIIYPNLDPTSPPNDSSLAGSTYDGTWRFFMEVDKVAVFGTRPDTAFVDIWDGDMDVGSYDGTNLDTDDLNTPGAPFLPPWSAGTTAVAERAVTTASPCDDNRNALLRRSPSIRYLLKGPDNAIYTNDNPSGSQEWERFSASLLGGVPMVHDLAAAHLPDGIYEAVISGMDLNNMNAWRSTFKFIGVCDTGGACAPVPADAGGTGTTCRGTTATRGYWKNHPEIWPVVTVEIGGAPRTAATLLEWLSGDGADKFTILASQLVAAMMNVANGADDECVSGTIALASEWVGRALPQRPVVGRSHLWSGQVREWAERLDAYNNGLLCAPHRDSAGCDGVESTIKAGSGNGRPKLR
jgi:hypothetical protein